MANNNGQGNEVISDFSYGELSPRLFGRVDSAIYKKGAQTLQNFVPMIQGGFRKRTGLVSLGTVYNNNPLVRLHKVVITGQLWFMLEFSAASAGATATLRIWGNMLTTPSVVQTISIPYIGSELVSLQFGWAFPSLFIAHNQHAPASLNYVSGNTFSLTQPIPIVGSSAQYFTGLVFTSGNTYIPFPTNFNIASISANILQVLTITKSVYNAGPNTTTYTLSQNPQSSFWSFIGKVVTISGTGYTVLTVGSYQITIAGNVAYTGVAYMCNTGLHVSAIRYTSVLPESCGLSAITSTGFYLTLAPTANLSYVTMAISQDVDLPFQGAGNYPGAVACANQRVIWMSSTNAPQDVWASVVGIWDTYGFMSMQFFELITSTQQQVSTNSSGQPIDSSGHVITAALQNTPAYVNVYVTQEIIGDADGFNGAIYSDQNDAVQWCVSMVDMIFGTLSGQIEIDGNATANTYAFRNISRTGCAPIQGYFMTGGVLFVDRAAKRVLLLNWQGTQIQCPPPITLSLFSEHLFEQDPITQIAYSSSPVMRLWFLRASGTVVCCEYDDQYNVQAWWRIATGYNGGVDQILSIESGPGATEDLTYMAVQRGATVTFEVLDSPYWNQNYYSGTYLGAQVAFPAYLDCSVKYQNAVAFSSITTTLCPSLAYLGSRTVSIWGDGAYLGTGSVVAGTLNLPALGSQTTYNSVCVGLPFTSIMVSMPIDIGRPQDSTRGHVQTSPRLAITFISSLDANIASANSVAGYGGALPYTPAQICKAQKAFPSLFTGTERDPVGSGYGLDTAIAVKSSLPLPCTVTALIPDVSDYERMPQ